MNYPEGQGGISPEVLSVAAAAVKATKNSDQAEKEDGGDEEKAAAETWTAEA